MELLFVLVLGLLVLGPKQMHSMLGHMARVKAELEKSARGLTSQLAAELDGADIVGDGESPREALDK